MLQEQIVSLKLKEDVLELEVAEFEEQLKKKKNELKLMKTARQQLEKLEVQLNGQTDIPA